MIVYEAEKQVGLEEKILANASVSYVSPVLINSKRLNKTLASVGLANILQNRNKDITLFPIFSLLVSTGTNLNDDTFLPAETWQARFTPEDKPFNIAHEPRKIIGHITSNVVVDNDFNIIGEDTNEDNLPDNFHIITSAVVYKHPCSIDPELSAEADELIQSIQNGEWFVSMEAIFQNFDYYMVNDVESKVIARGDDTAFLTKHLRCYGGSGEYNGCKISRVLRDITFSGKGLVKNPGNPASVIFNINDDINHLFSNSNLNSTSREKEELTMADNVNDKLEKQLEEYKQQLAEANQKIESLGEAQVQAKIDSKDREVKEAKSNIEALQAQVDELTMKVDELTKANEEADKAKSEAVEAKEKAEAEIAEIKEKAKITARVSTLVDAGLEKEKAQEIVEKFADANDETFDEVVSMQKDIVEAKKGYDKDMEEDKKKDKDMKDKDMKDKESKANKEDEGEDEEADEEGETNASSVDADDFDDDEDADYATSADVNDDTQNAMAEYLSKYLEKARK